MNNPFKSIHKHQDHLYPLRKTQYDILVFLLTLKGYSSNRFSVLSPGACGPTINTEEEERKEEWVELYISALNAGINLDTITDVSDCDITLSDAIALRGTYASRTTALTGADNDLKFTARNIGLIGNIISVTYVVAGNNTALSVSVSGNDIIVNSATNGSGVATSTSAQVKTAVQAFGPANSLVKVDNAASNSGLGAIIAMAKLYLMGGVN